MKFKRKVQQIAGTIMIGIPRDLAKYYNYKKGDVLTLEDTEEGILIFKEEKNGKK